MVRPLLGKEVHIGSIPINSSKFMNDLPSNGPLSKQVDEADLSPAAQKRGGSNPSGTTKFPLTNKRAKFVCNVEEMFSAESTFSTKYVKQYILAHSLIPYECIECKLSMLEKQASYIGT